LLAGGGIPGGTIFGASDKSGAYPARDAVTPADVAATIYRLMGIPLATKLFDPGQNREVELATGLPIREIAG
jgi:hypothetical protein